MGKALFPGPGRHKLRLRLGVVAKPVVDCGNVDRRRMPPSPSGCEPHEGDRVGSSRDSKKSSTGRC